jgi:chemotaxis protein MotB
MHKHTFTIATILSALVVVVIIGFSKRELNRDLTETKEALQAAKTTSDETLKQLEALRAEAEANKQTIEKLEKEKLQSVEAQKGMEKEMRAALESRDVTISELQGRLSVNILDKVLFNSGEAILRPEGESVLAQVAKVLEQYPKRQVQVIGHTDNIPIRAGAKYADNWELSLARALAAVRFMSEKAGVDPRRLAAAGYGEHHPVASNSTSEGRAKNRRITLVVLPEELSLLEVELQKTNEILKATSAAEK